MRSVALAAFLALVCVARMDAQQMGCGCPNGTNDTTANISICYAGGNYTIAVTWCNEILSPPALTACSGTYAVDRIVRFKKFCVPVGSGIPFDTIVYKVQMALDPCCGNFWNIQFPTTATVYCILYVMPKCWLQTGLCWNPCQNSPCCAAIYDYSRPSAGVCQRLVRGTCPATGDCGIGCTVWGCTWPLPQDCPCP